MNYLNVQNKIQFIQISRLYLLYGMIITIVFSRLNLNGLCIILFTLTWLIEGGFKYKWSLLKKDNLFIAYALYFLIQFAGLAQSENIYSGWKGVESKLGYLVLPMVFCSTSFLNISMRRKVMLVFSLAITLAALYCLAIAAIQYFGTGDNIFFFLSSAGKPNIASCHLFFRIYFHCSCFSHIRRGLFALVCEKPAYLHKLDHFFAFLFISIIIKNGFAPGHFIFTLFIFPLW